MTVSAVSVACQLLLVAVLVLRVREDHRDLYPHDAREHAYE